MRSEKIDIVKCIGILAVVCGHAGLGHTFFSQFHMPLFAFVSGYLFVDKYADSVGSVGKYIVKKIKTIYLPFVGFELLFLAFHNVFYKLDLINSECGQMLYGPKDFLKQALRIITLGGGERLVGQLWFLISLFEITIIFCVIIFFKKKIERITNEKVAVAFVAIVVIALYILAQYVAMPRQLNQSFVLLLYYAIGFLMKQSITDKYKLKIKKYKYYFVLLSIGVILLCMRFHPSWDLQKNYWIGIISAIYGILLAFCLAEILNSFVKGKAKKFLIFIGQSTLIILTFHVVCMNFVEYFYVRIFNLSYKLASTWPPMRKGILLSIVYVVVGLSVSLLIQVLVNKTKTIVKKGKKKKGLA